MSSNNETYYNIQTQTFSPTKHRLTRKCRFAARTSTGTADVQATGTSKDQSMEGDLLSSSFLWSLRPYGEKATPRGKRKSGRITAPSNRERAVAVAVAAPRAQVSGASPTGRSRLGRALPPVTRKLIKLAAAPRRGERARPRSEPLLWRARRGPAFACKRCYDHGGSPSKATAVDHRLTVVENERKHAAGRALFPTRPDPARCRGRRRCVRYSGLGFDRRAMRRTTASFWTCHFGSVLRVRFNAIDSPPKI